MYDARAWAGSLRAPRYKCAHIYIYTCIQMYAHKCICTYTHTSMLYMHILYTQICISLSLYIYIYIVHLFCQPERFKDGVKHPGQNLKISGGIVKCLGPLLRSLQLCCLRHAYGVLHRRNRYSNRVSRLRNHRFSINMRIYVYIHCCLMVIIVTQQRIHICIHIYIFV